MATISKFYLLDAATPNTGTMPSAAMQLSNSSTVADGEAPGALTVRDATDVAGTSNPDLFSTVTATANQTTQSWGHRRFVSRPLAAHTFTLAEGAWTFSYARSQSNTAHHQVVRCTLYFWTPSTGLKSGSGVGLVLPGTDSAATTEVAESVTNSFGGNAAILDGDIAVFDIATLFTQTMSSAYTEKFDYNGTTEASTTTCASFVTPPVAVTLFTASAAIAPVSTFVLQAQSRAAVR